jgi:anti-sigma factor RsiW
VNTANPRHLSEEAMDDALIGIATAETEAHLATCDVCRAQVASFQLQMDSFNAATMAWSERKIAAQPIRVDSNVKPWRGVFVPSPAWAMAAIIVLTIAALMLHWNTTHNSIRLASNDTPAPAVTGINSTMGDSAIQIEQDNQLLQSVNAALTTADESPAMQFDLRNDGSAGSLQYHSKARPGLRNL